MESIVLCITFIPLWIVFLASLHSKKAKAEFTGSELPAE
jgi:hypothetical protein